MMTHPQVDLTNIGEGSRPLNARESDAQAVAKLDDTQPRAETRTNSSDGRGVQKLRENVHNEAVQIEDDALRERMETLNRRMGQRLEAAAGSTESFAAAYAAIFARAEELLETEDGLEDIRPDQLRAKGGA